MAKKCPKCSSPYLVEKVLKSGVFLECPNKKKSAEEEAAGQRSAARSLHARRNGEKAVVCTYSKRIGDAPPPPTAETHGPVVEKNDVKSRSCSPRKIVVRRCSH